MNYIISKIYETLHQDSKYDENDPYVGIKMLEKFALSQFLFVSKSIDDYLSGRRSIKKKLIVLILQLCVWIFLLKTLFISYYNNKAFFFFFLDFFYFYPRLDILNVMILLMLTGIEIVGKN